MNDLDLILGYGSQIIYLIILYFRHSDKERFIRIFSNKYSILACTAIIFLVSYYYFGGFSTKQPQSFLGDPIQTTFITGWDQSAYYRMLLRMVNGEWFHGGYAAQYFYPLGYPIAAVPFHYLYPANPFLFLNLSIVLLSISYFYKRLNYFFNPALVLIILFLVLFQTPLNNWNTLHHLIMLMPWNNLVSIGAGFIFFYFLFKRNPIKLKSQLLLGLLLGWVFASRYGDVFYFTPLVIGILFKGNWTNWSIESFSNVFKNGLAFIFGALILVIPTLISHKYFYGNWMDTYITYAIPDGHFFPFFLEFKVHLFKFLEVFFIPSIGDSIYPNTLSGFFVNAPYIFFFPLGVYRFYKNENMKPEVVLALLFLLFNIYYFNSTGATSAIHIKYQCLRYFCTTIPFFIFFSFYGIKPFLQNESSNRTKLIIGSIGILLAGAIIFRTIQKSQFFDLSKPSVEVNFENRSEDYMSKDKHPINYRKDGIPDYKFKAKINSFFPVRLLRVKITFQNGNGESWISARNNDQTLWGVGIVNEYGNNVDFNKNGDNTIYKNIYLPDDKELIIYIPTPHTLKGNFKFDFYTNRGLLTETVYVN